MPIGAHVGVAAGYANAVDYAVSVGAECLQIFAKSPRQWHARPLSPVVTGQFGARIADVGMGPVLVHTAYLINLGSSDDTLWERSWAALADELQRAEALGGTFVVTHTGTEYRTAPAETAARIAAGVDRAWERAGVSSTRLLLENTAGAGTTYGDGPRELGAVLDRLLSSADHVGVCLDTCHAHAAGWDLAQPDTWARLLAEFDEWCGQPIQAIHANDCLSGSGLRRDRHAWIGDGTIGYAGFAAMFSEPRLARLPIVTEMPGDIPEKDSENISRLKRLRDTFAAPASSVST